MAVITALMTTYNGAGYIRETIDSVLAQTYKDFVFLIIDDGSTDDTVEIIKSYQDPRIELYVSAENKGVGYQLKEATQYIKTPYIVKIDSDDISHPERFAKQLAYMQANPELDIIKCYYSYFADNEEVEKSARYQQYKSVKEHEHNAVNTSELIEKSLPRWMCVGHTTTFYKTKLLHKIGYEDIRIGEDYALFYQALKAGFKFDCLKKHLVKVRVHQNSATTHADTASIYTQVVLDLKKQEIHHLAQHNQHLKIFGQGGLGQATEQWLLNNGFNFAGYIERNEEGLLDKVESNTGVLIAAQPVREEIIGLLEQQGMQEWQDFLVVG